MRWCAFAWVFVLATMGRVQAAPRLAGMEYVEAGPPDGPVVVALHWQGGDPRDLVALIAASEPTLHVLAPSAGVSHSWYEGSSTAVTNPSLRAAADRLTAFLAEVDARYGTPIVAGYSQGGIMALAIAASRPSLARAIVAVSGRLPGAYYERFSDAATPPPILLLHGSRDTTIPYASAERTAAAFSARRYFVELRPFAKDGHALSAARTAAFLAALRLAALQKSGVASPPK